MKKKLLGITLLFFLIFCLFSCELIKDLKKYYDIPNVIYGNWQHLDDSRKYCDQRYVLMQDGCYEFYSKKDLENINPIPSEIGTYTVQYKGYSVDSANGVITFFKDTQKSADLTVQEYSSNFLWNGTQQQGPVSLKLYDSEAVYSYVWAEVE